MTPAPARSRAGNRVTATRWARMLRSLGHRVSVAQQYRAQRCDLLVALHARKSAASVRRFHAQHPERPIVIALTGTDVYHDLQRDARAKAVLDLADRFVVLQGAARRELPPRLRSRVRIIHQSVPPWPLVLSRPRSRLQVCVLGHLRAVKDPFRAALATERLPRKSRIVVRHAGAALTPWMAARARALMQRIPRYRWLGELPRTRALALLRRSHLLVLSSIMEGGANVVSEALAARTPVLASRIPGSVGLLGRHYPGYFAVRDTRALTALLARAECDARFYRRLVTACRRRRSLVAPARERSAWRALLAELGAHHEGHHR